MNKEYERINVPDYFHSSVANNTDDHTAAAILTFAAVVQMIAENFFYKM